MVERLVRFVFKPLVLAGNVGNLVSQKGRSLGVGPAVYQVGDVIGPMGSTGCTMGAAVEDDEACRGGKLLPSMGFPGRRCRRVISLIHRVVNISESV